MKVNNISNINYSPNFGIKISPKAEKQILNAMENDVISWDNKIFEKIKKIPSECTLVGFRKLITLDNICAHISRGWPIPMRITVSSASKILPYKLRRHDDINKYRVTDNIIPAIKSAITGIVYTYEDRLARKGLLKDNLNVLKEEFPEDIEYIDRIYEDFKLIDDFYAALNRKKYNKN
ncbi:MAG: hypothetical protein MJ231_00565 [bacterium]|nr:hypothetical protein [bacterium]